MILFPESSRKIWRVKNTFEGIKLNSSYLRVFPFFQSKKMKRESIQSVAKYPYIRVQEELRFKRKGAETQRKKRN